MLINSGPDGSVMPMNRLERKQIKNSRLRAPGPGARGADREVNVKGLWVEIKSPGAIRLGWGG